MRAVEDGIFVWEDDYVHGQETQLDFCAEKREEGVRSMHPMVVHLQDVRAEREATVVDFQSRLFCTVFV
jgi:hypothetical protein